MRQLLREDRYCFAVSEAYPNLEVKSKELAKKLKAQAEAVQESVEEKKQAVADAVAEGKLAAEAAAEERRLAAEERKQLVQEAVEEKKIAFEEKKQAVALAVKSTAKAAVRRGFSCSHEKADQKKREEKIRKGNKNEISTIVEATDQFDLSARHLYGYRNGSARSLSKRRSDGKSD